MQTNFLTLYPKLKHPNSATVSVNVNGFWLVHGDEPLLQQWLVDALRLHWQHQYMSVKRIELVSSATWHEVLSELNSLSLFDDATAIVVTGNHKPDKKMQDKLLALAQGSLDNALLWLTKKLDKKAKSAKWIVPFNQFGQMVDCHLYDERSRKQILDLKADEFGVRLSDDAWQILMLQTEHNLLGAYQTLWRLADLYALKTQQPTLIDTEKLQDGLISQSQFTAFDLSDAMLVGNVQQVANIIHHLKEADEPPSLVLWTLAKDMRLIQQIMDGKSPQSLGIWRNKQSLYVQAIHRHTPASIANWTTLLYDCDRAIKGVIRQPAWELILQASLMVAGVQLFV